MKKIFIISGKAESGKDTTYEIMKKHLEFHNKKCVKIAYGDYVKFIAKQYFNWNGIKNKEGRHLLQYLGTDLVRNKMKKPNFWTERVIDNINIIKNHYDYIFITDARYPNEIELVKQAFPNYIQTIRINRPNHKSKLTLEQKKHESETALDNYDFDTYIISTKGLKELESKILSIFNFIKPMINYNCGDKVKIKKINSKIQAPHLLNKIGQVGHIYSYIIKKGHKKYKVLFDDNETAYFFGNELELIK